jgi:hypothetical protein
MEIGKRVEELSRMSAIVDLEPNSVVLFNESLFIHERMRRIGNSW